VHHFVTRQPFYLRQLTANRVLPLMKQLVNDIWIRDAMRSENRCDCSCSWLTGGAA
jgi:hypothetical protein